jgi:hypothetical protein
MSALEYCGIFFLAQVAVLICAMGHVWACGGVQHFAEVDPTDELDHKPGAELTDDDVGELIRRFDRRQEGTR